MLNTLDLCSGIGGFRSGLEPLNCFRFVGHCEIDEKTEQAYRALYNTEGDYFCSDIRKIYVDNRLGGFVKEHQRKPDCPLIGQDGNIFNLMGIASRTLREAGLADQAKEMCQRIHASGSYGEALNIIGDYVNITSVDDGEDEGEDDDEDYEMEM